jgi:hypothetical protein
VLAISLCMSYPRSQGREPAGRDIGRVAALRAHKVTPVSSGDLVSRLDFCRDRTKQARGDCAWVQDKVEGRFGGQRNVPAPCAHRPLFRLELLRASSSISLSILVYNWSLSVSSHVRFTLLIAVPLLAANWQVGEEKKCLNADPLPQYLARRGQRMG